MHAFVCIVPTMIATIAVVSVIAKTNKNLYQHSSKESSMCRTIESKPCFETFTYVVWSP